jgi:hypothetical protein
MAHVKLFISYAHKDDESFAVFKPEIKEALNKSMFFTFDAWEDSGIPVGTKWDDYIQKKLKNCKIAILCVSDNFFSSTYIKNSEFNELIHNYNKALIVPIYFAACNIGTWQDLSEIQFFKPPGTAYGLQPQENFSFEDLLKSPNISAENRKDLIARYCEDLSLHIQQAYIEANIADEEPKKLSDKIVTYVIIAAIIGALIFTFYSLLFDKETKQFSSIMGSGVFFGSFAAFTYNKKSH